ncbi:hypothetical protein PsorP6_008802 [Peronosclerospora sorghi]|uniref:Uncharacterized protein n=1 Tax=Peronosclerospora sorghi TaxID=230839 RepID=A0ACC0W0U0_9STRA|nr:hypothetical protein PsorP6_008802 [Peronosclerospora sorghi]
METVRKRPHLQKSAKRPQDASRNASHNKIEAAIPTSSTELGPKEIGKDDRHDEEDLMNFFLNEGTPKAKILLSSDASSSLPRDGYNKEVKTFRKDVDYVTETQDSSSAPSLLFDATDGSMSAPSAPSFDDEVLAEITMIPLQEKPSAPPLMRSIPRTFHEITVAAGNDAEIPSAPMECEDNNVGDQSKPSPPSFSPAASKKWDRVVASPYDSEKSNYVMRKPAKASTKTSAGDTNVAVWNSIAKLQHYENKDGVLGIYPSIPPEASATAISGREETVNGPQASYKQLLEKKHLNVKLEPFINYEMNLMRAEASQKRHEKKMRRIESNKGELYARVERYLFSEYLMLNAASTMDEYKQKIDVFITKVWNLEKKRVSSSKRCGDNVEIQQHMEFQAAKMEAQELEKLKAHLDKLRRLRTVEASMHTFNRANSYFQVEQYLNSVLLEPNLVAFLNKMSSTHGSSYGFEDLDIVSDSTNFYEAFPQGSKLASSVDHLKYCLDVLIFFEKKVTVGEKGMFGRVPQSFSRGEIIWHSDNAKMHFSAAGGSGMQRKIKCYACGSLNIPTKSSQWCDLCVNCDVVLYIPPSAVSKNSNEWFTSVLRFRQSLQKWISICMQNLLRTKSLQNMPYILMHVMYLPRVSTDERGWLLRFLQFPRAMICSDGSLKNEWSEDLVDHYIAMLHLVFHPEELRRMSIIVSSGPPNGTKHISDNKEHVSHEWVLLENPELLDRYFLSDEDFVAVLNQFPNTFAFKQIFGCTLDVKKCFSRALTLVLEFTHGMRAFYEFEKLPTRIAQLLEQLLSDAAELPGSGRLNENQIKDATFYPTLFDQLFLTSLHGLMAADCNRVAWKSMHLLPFGSLTEPAKWDVLALLLFNQQTIPAEAKTASGWMQFFGEVNIHGVDTAIQARRQLYLIIESDSESAMYLLNAVASLAASCQASPPSGGSRYGDRHDLVSVAIHELFIAGYTVEPCKLALGKDGERAAGPISTICLAHPWVVSLLIKLLFKYHQCAATWIHVFETFPINRWVPNAHDLLNLQEWLLLEDTAAPRSALARFLLDRINWEHDFKRQRLFTDAMLHRQVALMVAEALVLYKTRKEHTCDPESTSVLSGGGSPQKLEVSSIAKSIRRALWLADTVDFEKWCWKLMLKLRFYSPKTQEPLLPLIDLRHDRTREALILRRWFAGSSVLRILPTRESFPFYLSLEEQVRQLGPTGHNPRHSNVGPDIDVKTGAPVHQDNRILLTPHNIEEIGEEDIKLISGTPRTEPIVAYVICQMTTFMFSDRLDRWEPLLVLLKLDIFSAAMKVLENLLPVLARLNKMKEFSFKLSSTSTLQGKGKEEAKTIIERNTRKGDYSAEPSCDENEIKNGAPEQRSCSVDNELEICMAAMQNLSTDELLSLLNSLHEFSYINSVEHHHMQEVLKKGYVGGWESLAKERVLTKLRFVRECSRYLHPIVLPALINEYFPHTSPMSVTTSAIFHGAMSWISSALGSENSTGALSPSTIASTCAALSVQNSSFTAIPGSFAMVSRFDYSKSTKSLCALIRRSFEYSVDSMSLSESMRFWMKALLRVPLWYENAAFRHVLDVMLHCSMECSSVGDTENLSIGTSSRILYELVDLIEAAFESYCEHISRQDENARQPNLQSFEYEAISGLSFLPSVAPSSTFASLFCGPVDVAQYVGGCPYLALWSLLVETRKEVPLFLAIGQIMIQFEPNTMKKLEKMTKTKGKLASALNASRDGKCLDEEAEEIILDTPSRASQFTNPLEFGHTRFDSLSQYKIYRWCNYCLHLPESEPTQVIYWQVLFALYFATASGCRVFGHHFLDRISDRTSKRIHIRKQLQLKLRKLVSYCSNQAQVVLTATDSASNGNTSKDLKKQQYAHLVALSQLYAAMDAWLAEKDPNQWLKEDEMSGLPHHYEIDRLKDVLRLSDILLNLHAIDLKWSDLPLWTSRCGFRFAVRRAAPSMLVVDKSDDSADSSMVSSPVTGGDEDGFAFVEEASKLTRQHNSFEGLRGLNSLDAKPLPLAPVRSTLTLLPTVSVVVSPQECAILPSVPLNKAGLKAMALKSSESLSVLVALDSEMMDNVSQLFISKARSVTLSLSCPEGSNCSNPASFRFEYIEWMKDPRAHDAIQSIRAQGERYDMSSMSVTNKTLSTIRHDSEISAKSLLTPVSTAQFLQLDDDGLMLSHQILLIEQIVQTLSMEHGKLQRLKQTLRTKTPIETATIDDGLEATYEENITNISECELLSPMKKTEQELERLHEKGLEWFRLLTELDSKLSRMVPPLREALWRSIKQLGLSFVCFDERETCTLLQLMLDDPSRINLLSECFFPATAPLQFVEMFAKLMSTSRSSKLSGEEKLVVLRRFDFSAWLKTDKVTKLDRDTVLCMILGDISHTFPADRSLTSSTRKSKDVSDQLEEILRVYAKVLHLICSTHLNDHIEQILHSLVGIHDDYRFLTLDVDNRESSPCTTGDSDSNTTGLSALPRPVDAVVWEAVATIPFSSWKEVPLMKVESCVTFLSQHMTSLRWQGGLVNSFSTERTGDVHREREMQSAALVLSAKYPIVYWQRLGVLKGLLALVTLFCRVTPQQKQWELIIAFFEPLLSTLYQPATNSESSTINAPWSEQDTLSTGTTICSCFVATCSEYLKTSPATGLRPNLNHLSLTQTAKLSQIWSYYLTVLVPHAPTHICKHFHQFLTRLAWEHWCLTLEIVQQMRELVQSEKQQLMTVAIVLNDPVVPPLHSTTSSYPFVSWLVRDVLCRTTWKSTNEWLSSQSEAVCSSFLLEFAKLCLELVLDLPHFHGQSGQAASANVLPPYFVNFIKQQSAFWSKWKLTVGDLETLQHFMLDAFKEPLETLQATRNVKGCALSGSFPVVPSAAVMQDALTRLQLALRLFGQITTLNHDKLLKRDSMQRVLLFLKLMFGVFEVTNHASRNGKRYNFDNAAWLMVLYGSCCISLYEKLDEIVQSCKENGSEVSTNFSEKNDGILEDDLTATISEVLRFCNLPLVENFFTQMLNSSKSSSKSASSSSVLNWNKCGNVVLVEIDALVRDVASRQKALHYRSHQHPDPDADQEEPLRHAGLYAAQSPTEAIGAVLGKIVWNFIAFRGGELACIAACGRALASVHVMSQVAEKSIEKWIIEERRGMWDALALRLHVPELSGDEFELTSLEQGNLLTLQVLFLQQLRQAPVLTESLGLALVTKLIGWIKRARVENSEFAQMKLLFMAAEVTNFVCKSLAEVLPSMLKKKKLRQVSELLLELGHARRNNGIMKAIGLGGSLQYSVEFHVSCLAAGVFLRLQTRNGAPLRMDDRIPFKMTRNTEKHLLTLQAMLQSKDSFQLGNRADVLVDFSRDPHRSLADQDEFFVTLFSSIVVDVVVRTFKVPIKADTR